ncbi:hypothetical protein KP509_17G084600 [Ceratopteris richardii]|nr:hypothetical protein KP509_17G084600 [Ceratopteris richardii]
MNQANGLQLALDNVKVNTQKVELESFELQNDLETAKESLYENQLRLTKFMEEADALKGVLKEKDALIETARNQQIDFERFQQEKLESLQQELDKYKAMDIELHLEKEQMKIAALEDIRKRELDSIKDKENSWRKEREKLVADLNHMHDVVDMKKAHEQEIEEKVLRADDAIRRATELRTVLQEEISELKLQLEKSQMQVTDSECSLILLERSKKDEVTALSEILQLKSRELQASQQEFLQQQDTIATLIHDAEKCHEHQEKIISLEKRLKIKEEELHVLSLSQEESKIRSRLLQDEHHKEIDDLGFQLAKSLECKEKAEKRVEECEIKLKSLHMVLEKASMSKAVTESDLKVLEDSLARLQEENCSLQSKVKAQEEDMRAEAEVLNEIIRKRENELSELRRHTAEIEDKLIYAMQQEGKWKEDAVVCEALREQLQQKSLEQRELLDSHRKELLHWSAKESAWVADMESLMNRACIAEENLATSESKLKNIFSEFQCLELNYNECKQKMITCEDQIAQLQSMLDANNLQQHCKEKELQSLHDEFQLKVSSFAALSQEKDSALFEAKKKIENLESRAYSQSAEYLVCIREKEELKKATQEHEAEIMELKGTIADLEKCLSEKDGEILEVAKMKQLVEANLMDSREDFVVAKREYELQIQLLKDTVSAVEAKLHHSSEILQKKEREMETLITTIESMDATNKELENLNLSLQEEKKMLNQSVDALQSKMQMLVKELESEKILSNNLCICMEDKDRSIGSLSDELKNLQGLLNIAHSNNQEVARYEVKLKSLENELAEASACLRDTEEKLSASEWAVQQLANEVGKAKTSLAQKERDEVLLQSRMSDMETRSKAKEKQLMDLDHHLQNLINKNSQKQTEMEKLIQAFEETKSKMNELDAERRKLISEIQERDIELERIKTELARLEEQLKQSHSKETLMEDAIKSLKSQIASHEQLSQDQDSQLKQLLDKLETAHSNEAMMLERLNETETKLQQADQRFKVETEKLRNSLIDTQEQLSSLLIKDADLERDLLAAMEETERQKDKISAASESVADKELALKDLTHKFDSLQEELAQQQKHMCMSEEELVKVKAELASYIEKSAELNDKVSVLNQEMEEREIAFASHLAAFNGEICSRDEEIQEIRQAMGMVSAERESLNDKVIMLTEELDASSGKLQCKDIEIARLEETKKGLENDLLEVKTELASYIEKGTELNEKVCLLNHEVEERAKTYTDRLAALDAKIHSRDKEIQEIKRAMDIVSAERESVNEKVMILTEELDTSSRKLQCKDIEIATLEETKKDLKNELSELEENTFRIQKELESASVQLESAKSKCLTLDDKCRHLEEELGHATSSLQMQFQEMKSLVTSNKILKEELEEKQTMLCTLDLKSRNELEILNSTLEEYRKKELALQAQLPVLLKKVRELLHLAGQHEVENVQPLVSAVFDALKEVSGRSYDDGVFNQKKIANLIDSKKELGLISASANMHKCPEMLVPLYSAIEELHTEQQRQGIIEASVCKMATSMVLHLIVKEQDIQGLQADLTALRTTEDEWNSCAREIFMAQLELENELSVLRAQASNPLGEYQFVRSCSQTQNFLKEMHLFSGRWKTAINVLKEFIMSEMHLLKEEVAKSGCLFESIKDASTFLGFWTPTLLEDFSQLKENIKILVQELRQKDCTLTNETKKVQTLQSMLKGKVEDENTMKELISSLHIVLVKMLHDLAADEDTIQHVSTSALNIHKGNEEELESNFQENLSRLELEKVVRFAEILNKEIRSRDEVFKTELSRWKDEAETAKCLVCSLNEELTKATLQVESFQGMEQLLGGELQDLMEKMNLIQKEANDLKLQLQEVTDVKSRLEHQVVAEKGEADKLRLQLLTESEKSGHLECQVLSNREELSQLEIQMSKMKQIIELETEKSQDLIVRLKMANKEIEESQLELDLFKSQRASIDLDIANLKENVSLAYNEKASLASELESTKEMIKVIEADKDILSHELGLWKERTESGEQQNNLLMLELENHTQAVKELQVSLEALESANHHLQSRCEKLKTELISAHGALSKIQHGVRENCSKVESRLQVIYDEMAHGEDFDFGQSDNPGESSDKNDCIPNHNQAAADKHGKDLIASTPFSASHFDVDGAGGIKHTELDLDHYLRLCDSLISRHALLEKTLENLEISTNTSGRDQEQVKDDEAETTGWSEKRKKRMLSTHEVCKLPSKAGVSADERRKPLQPIIAAVSPVIATGISSPCAKRRCSNERFQDQNHCQ